MKRVDIFEQAWLDLVFEGRNKEYGAYELRRETSRTTMMALLLGILITSSIVTIPMLIKNAINPTIPVIELPEDLVTKIELSLVEPTLPNKPKVESIPLTEVENDTQLVDPEVVTSNEANQNIAENSENTASTVETTESGTASGTTNPTSEGTGTTEAATVTNEIVRTQRLDKLPAFPGGIDKFYKFVGENFERPTIDVTKNIKVYVSFVIEKDGTLTDIKVLNDPGYGLAKEAIRVLKSLRTKWQPGIINGQPVRTAYDLPIIVKME